SYKGIAYEAALRIKIAPITATPSSRRAAGRSFPKILARADRAAAPPRVPMTAPIAPPAIPSESEPRDIPMVAPDTEPEMMRKMKDGGAFRLGVEGSLSTISSPRAAMLKIQGVQE